MKFKNQLILIALANISSISLVGQFYPNPTPSVANIKNEHLPKSKSDNRFNKNQTKKVAIGALAHRLVDEQQKELFSIFVVFVNFLMAIIAYMNTNSVKIVWSEEGANTKQTSSIVINTQLLSCCYFLFTVCTMFSSIEWMHGVLPYSIIATLTAVITYCSIKDEKAVDNNQGLFIKGLIIFFHGFISILMMAATKVRNIDIKEIKKTGSKFDNLTRKFAEHERSIAEHLTLGN